MSAAKGDPDAGRGDPKASSESGPTEASEEIPEELRDKIGRLPTSPGVYIMKDARSRILYIGKAVNLRSRVRSYFGKSSDTRFFLTYLVRKVADIDCVLVDSEAEALILENNLIKKHRPVYNVRLKDDKTYVSIVVTLSEDWPRVRVTRRYKKNADRYFGPYGSASAVREMLRMIKTVFPLRTCTNGFFKSRKRPCLEYEIGRCTAPCVDLIDRAAYQEDVDQVILFLEGKNKQLERIVTERMEQAAERRAYELAARYRDQLAAIRRVFETQKAQEFRLGDLDVFATVVEGEYVAVQELLVRGGKIVNSQCHSFKTSLDPAQVLSSFLTQSFLADRFVPPELLIDRDFEDRPLIETWLTQKREAKARVYVPQRGDKAALMRLAEKNARNSFRVDRTEQERIESMLESLRTHLQMERPPRRIECYDISNFQGSLAVGAMVSFEDGQPVKSRYRKFRIQTVVGADDFRCMQEVLERRLARGREEEDLPDLLVIDGGKGQLGVATSVLRKLGLDDLAVIGLAKERRRKLTTERVFLPGARDPIPLAQDTQESLYLQRIRDEAHRFAIGYHRELRKKKTLRTGLEDIPGVGKKRIEALIRQFGTLKRISTASQAAIADVVGPKLAERIHEALSAPDDSVGGTSEPKRGGR